MIGYTQHTTTTERYALASKARTKLLNCAAQSSKKDLNLRLLVGHANLLDRVMESLHNNDAQDDTELEEDEPNFDEIDEPVHLVRDDTDKTPNYVTGNTHVSFTLPAAPEHTIYEYSSDSDSESDSASEDEDYSDGSDDSDDYEYDEDYQVYDHDNVARARQHVEHSAYLRRPATYTLAHGESMTKPTGGDLLLVSIPEDNEEGDHLSSSAPRQLTTV
ncbi:LAFA_0C10506g1_1 [Lachancea sp. 'fantastica']|nr:LAFA_0C10506g1_1 [Lachancea sp. 'fantastica']